MTSKSKRIYSLTGSRLQTQRALIRYGEKLEKLVQRLQTCVRVKDCDLFSVAMLAKDIESAAQDTYDRATKQKQTFTFLPVDLSMMIATFNRDPSLRTLGLTCKTWQNMLRDKRNCVKWTHFGNSALYSQTTLALTEFTWCHLKPIPAIVKENTEHLLSFTESEGIEVRVNRMIYHKIDQWSTWEEGWIRTLQDNVRLVAVDIAVSGLRFVTLQGTLYSFFSMHRSLSGGFQDAIEHGIVAQPCDHSRVDTWAWSPESFFILFSDHCTETANVIRYEFNTCRETMRSNVYCHFSESIAFSKGLYMTWFSNVLILGMKFCSAEEECDHIDNCDSCDAQLVLIDCDTNYRYQLPKASVTLDELYDSCVARLQLYGQSPVYLSFAPHWKDEVATTNGRINVWGPEACLYRPKRKKRAG